MSKQRLFQVLTMACVVLAGSPAGAQFRPDQPPTLERPTVRVPAPIDDASFRSAYLRVGQPRIVVFWNRALEEATFDMPVNKTVISRDRDSDQTSSSDTTTGSGAASTLQESTARVHDRTEITSGQVRSKSKSRQSLVEPVDWSLQDAFQSELLSAAVRITDRTLLHRTARGDNPRMDEQDSEIAGLKGRADIVLEVLYRDDAASPTHLQFHVTARDLASGALLASFNTVAFEPPPYQADFVAGPTGFTRVKAPQQSLAAIGRRLARETRQALASAWRSGQEKR